MKRINILVLLIICLFSMTGIAYSQSQAINWFQQGLKATTPQEKINCYANAIKLDPTFVEAYYNLAYVYKDLNDLVSAEKYFKKALLTKPEKISNELKLQIAYEMGINYKKLGRYDEAEDALLGAKNLALKYKIRSKILYELGRIYILLSKYDKAVEQFTEGMQLNGENQDKFSSAIKNAKVEKEANSYYNQGIEFAQNNQHEEAVAAFSKIIAIGPNYKDTAIRLKRSKEMIANQQQTEEINRQYARGIGYLKNKDWKNAMESFKAVIELDPNYKEVQQKLAAVKSQFDKSLNEQTLSKYYAEGMSAYRRGSYVNAMVAFGKVKELDPGYRDVIKKINDAQNKLDQEDEDSIKRRYYSLGEDALKNDDWETAVNSFKRVIKLESNYRNAASLLNQAQIGKESEQEMDKISRYYIEGLADFNRGDWLKAVIAFEKVKELDPQYKDANIKLLEAEENLKIFASNNSGASIGGKDSDTGGSNNWLAIGAILTALILPIMGTLLFSPTTRARLLLLQGKYSHASLIYEQLLYKHPEKLKLYITLANIYLVGNRTDETALRVYETVLQMDVSPQLKQRLSSVISQRYLTRSDFNGQSISMLEDELRREIRNLGGNL